MHPFVWSAPRATQAMYPDGYGEKVEDPAEISAALERALKAVTIEKRQAVLNVSCGD